MKLKNYITITGPYKGGSKDPFFKALQIGDTVEVSTNVRYIGRGSRTGLYATILTLKNCNRLDVEPYQASMTLVAKALAKMEFVEHQQN